MNTADLATIKKMVHEHCGLLLEGVAEERLQKAIRVNMHKEGCTSLTTYQQLLSQNAEAFDKLIDQVTVNETYFFREPEQIKLLVEVLLPQILANKSPADQVRILSAGCSSGEEPYSLAIALREALGETSAKRIHLDAGDLDQTILKKARSGLYSNFSFRGVDPALRKRYFQASGRGYQLIPEIRQLVNFHELNLLAPVLPKQLNNYDIIFFRNVSIYFDVETRREIQKKFYEILQEDGFLILGSSETLGNNLGVFELVEQQNQYCFIKGSRYHPTDKLIADKQADKPTTLMPKASNPPSELGKQQEVNFVLPSLKSIQQLIIDKEEERALQLLDHLLINDSENQPAQLLKSWILLNNQAFTAADKLLEKAFLTDAWSIDVMLMKGLSAKWQGQNSSAIQWFKKVAYTSPECWPAHYYLADLCRNQQQLKAAFRSYQVVKRILTADLNAGDATQWIPLSLPAGDVLFLSQRHLQNLTTDMQMQEK